MGGKEQDGDREGQGAPSTPPPPPTLSGFCSSALYSKQNPNKEQTVPLKVTHPHAAQLPPHAFPVPLLLPPPLPYPPHFLLSPVICPPGAAIAVLRVQECLGLGPHDICPTPPPPQTPQGIRGTAQWGGPPEEEAPLPPWGQLIRSAR